MGEQPNQDLRTGPTGADARRTLPGSGFWADRTAGDAASSAAHRCPVCAAPLQASVGNPGWDCTRPGCREAIPAEALDETPPAPSSPMPVPPPRRTAVRLGAAVAVVVAIALVSLALYGRGSEPQPGPQPPVPTRSTQPGGTPPAPGSPAPTDTQLDPPVMTGTIRVGEHPMSISLDAAAGLAFTANRDGGDLSVIDLGAGIVLYTLEVPGRPSAVAADGDGVIYVADGQGQRVYGMDLTTGERVASWKVGRRPRALAVDPDLGILYVGVGGGVTLLDTETGAELRRVAVGTVADLVVDPETHQLLVLVADPATVGSIDPETGSWQVIEQVSAQVTGIDLDGPRGRLYLAGESLQELDLSTRAVRDFPVDGRPHTVRVDQHGGIAYLVDPDANLVTALSID